MEEWRDIKGYEGKYMVSNLGRVKSLNYSNTGKEGILNARDNGKGYLRVILWKDGKDKKYRINRLVAQAFIPNPDNLPEVNHKDEDKTNNRVENLEWCDRSYNVNYGTRNKKAGKKIAEKRSKPVFSVNKESGLIMWWQSASEAEKCTGIDHSSISKCCKGKKKSIGGYYWFYAESEEVCDEQE